MGSILVVRSVGTLLTASLAFGFSQSSSAQSGATAVSVLPQSDTALGTDAFVGGGRRNRALGVRSVATGGYGNTASGVGATVSGGQLNRASGRGTVVAGGSRNLAADGAYGYSTVGGGSDCRAEGGFATVSGGGGNVAGDFGDTIGGGAANETSGSYTTIAGGSFNTVESVFGTIGGGANNRAIGFDFSTVGGGMSNTASGSAATASGGEFNTASGRLSSVPGGLENLAAGVASLAAGKRAMALHDGAFVWGDSQDLDKPSSAADEFNIYASGGTRVFSSADGLAGVLLAPGAGSWTSVSDRGAKENVQPVDVQAVLRTLASIPITTWNYRAQEASIRHMGPMAQDFFAAFGLGLGARSIDTIDPDGVAFAALQGLHELVLKSADENAALRARVEQLEGLEAQLIELQAAVADLATGD